MLPIADDFERILDAHEQDMSFGGMTPREILRYSDE
jgi:hypothetical protein